MLQKLLFEFLMNRLPFKLAVHHRIFLSENFKSMKKTFVLLFYLNIEVFIYFQCYKTYIFSMNSWLLFKPVMQL